MVRVSKGNAVIAAIIAAGLMIVDDTAGGLTKSSPTVTQFQDASDEIIMQETALRERAVAALQALALRQ